MRDNGSSQDKDNINHPPPLIQSVTQVRGTGGDVRRSVECHEKLSNGSYCLTRTVCVTLVRPIKRTLSRFLNTGFAKLSSSGTVKKSRIIKSNRSQLGYVVDIVEVWLLIIHTYSVIKKELCFKDYNCE
jgi:hypothetical protein